MMKVISEFDHLTGNAAETHQHGARFLYCMASYFLVIPITAHLFVPLFYNSGALSVFKVCKAQESETFI